MTLYPLLPHRIGAAFEAVLATFLTLMALGLPEVALHDVAILLLDAPGVEPLRLVGALRRNMSAPLDLRPGVGALLDVTAAPLHVRANSSAGLHRPRAPFDTLMVNLPLRPFSSLLTNLPLRPFSSVLTNLALRPFGPLLADLAPLLGARLASLGAMAAAPLGLRLLGFLRPFGPLPVASAALGLGRSGNRKRRHGGDQKSFGHGPVPVGGVPVSKQSTILAKNA